MMQHSVLDNRKVGSSQPPGKDDAAQIEILKPITADEDKGSPHGYPMVRAVHLAID